MNSPQISPIGTDGYLYKELSEHIVGAAMTVLNTLRPGLKEKAYENALVIELRKRGHQVEQQRIFNVIYDGIVVDTLVPDLIVDDKVIVDPKWSPNSTRHTTPNDRISRHHGASSRSVVQFQRGQASLETNRPLMHLCPFVQSVASEQA